MATLTVLHLRNPVSGGQYRKTLQYGVHMQSAIDWRMGQVLNGLDPDKRSDNTIQDTEADMYACAFLPPNYPVPAHRYVIKKDYTNNRLIGLMLGATNIGLLVYWPLGYDPIETI